MVQSAEAAADPTRKQAAESSRQERQAPAEGQSDVLEALESVKQLVGEYGADRVKRMVDLLE